MIVLICGYQNHGQWYVLHFYWICQNFGTVQRLGVVNRFRHFFCQFNRTVLPKWCSSTNIQKLLCKQNFLSKCEKLFQFMSVKLVAKWVSYLLCRDFLAHKLWLITGHWGTFLLFKQFRQLMLGAVLYGTWYSYGRDHGSWINSTNERWFILDLFLWNWYWSTRSTGNFHGFGVKVRTQALNHYTLREQY